MTKPFILGLTGSIGMGKSTVAGFFRDAGVPVWDADETVHRLYSKGGAGVDAIFNLYPQAVDEGVVDRSALKDWIQKDPTALKKIETVIHPLVRQDRAEFLAEAAGNSEKTVVFDIPLLFETKAENDVDAVLVVTVPAEIQRARVLARPGMTEETFEMILSKQMPDAEKQARADYVIQSLELDTTRVAVQDLISKLNPDTTNA